MLALIREIFEPFRKKFPNTTFAALMKSDIMVALCEARERSHGPIDYAFLRQQFEDIGRAAEADSTRSLQVELGTDPFGEGKRLREERAQRRQNYDEHEALTSRRATGSAFAPYDMTNGAFDRPAVAPSRRGAGRTTKSKTAE